MLFRSTLFGNVVTSNAIKEATQLVGERNRTEISIQSAAINTSSGSCILVVTGDNEGATSVSDFSMMDVIVQFGEANNYPRRFTYTTGDSPSSAGDWAKELVSTSDLFQPGIFNPGEIIVIRGKLSLPEANDTAGTVTVGTDNGVIDTASFSITTPCT